MNGTAAGERVAEVSVKLVIAGAPNSGKRSILEAVAERVDAPPPRGYRAGPLNVRRTLWRDPRPLADGSSLVVALLTLDGPAPYNAAEELLVREADGIVFVIDVEPSRLQEAWESLLRLSDNTRRGGYDLRAVPLALQYHRADRHEGFEPARMDEWLGVPTGTVPRFVTSSSSPDLDGMAVDSVVEQIRRKIDEAAEVGGADD